MPAREAASTSQTASPIITALVVPNRSIATATSSWSGLDSSASSAVVVRSAIDLTSSR